VLQGAKMLMRLKRGEGDRCYWRCYALWRIHAFEISSVYRFILTVQAVIRRFNDGTLENMLGLKAVINVSEGRI